MSRPHLQHIRVNCPLLRLNGLTAAKYPQLFYDLVAVSPNKDILEAMAIERARIPDVNKGFNAMHLRIEDDWVRRCNEWSGLPTPATSLPPRMPSLSGLRLWTAAPIFPPLEVCVGSKSWWRQDRSTFLLLLMMLQ